MCAILAYTWGLWNLWGEVMEARNTVEACSYISIIRDYNDGWRIVKMKFPAENIFPHKLSLGESQMLRLCCAKSHLNPLRIEE